MSHLLTIEIAAARDLAISDTKERIPSRGTKGLLFSHLVERILLHVSLRRAATTSSKAYAAGCRPLGCPFFPLHNMQPAKHVLWFLPRIRHSSQWSSGHVDACHRPVCRLQHHLRSTDQSPFCLSTERSRPACTWICVCLTEAKSSKLPVFRFPLPVSLPSLILP